MIRPLAILVASTAAIWLLIAIPCKYLIGEWTLAYSGVAALSCLVPACLTLVVARWLMLHQPDQFLLAVLGGTGFRMFFVLGVDLYLTVAVPFFRVHAGLWAWFLIFYVTTLASEMAILLSLRGQDHK